MDQRRRLCSDLKMSRGTCAVAKVTIDPLPLEGHNDCGCTDIRLKHLPYTAAAYHVVQSTRLPSTTVTIV